MTFPRRITAICVALVAATVVSVVSVVSAAASGGAAEVSSTAWRVDPPPYLRVSPDERAARELVDLVNEVRVGAGLQPVAWNTQIASAARTHAAYMASTGRTVHEGPPGITASQRLDAVGVFWTTWGETIGGGYENPQSLLDGWLNSPIHRQSLTNPIFQYAGAGVVASPDGTPFWSFLLVATTEIPIP